jgi:NitT/TauT family transport system substrate-binding protein
MKPNKIISFAAFYIFCWLFSAITTHAQTLYLGHSGVGISGTLRTLIEREKLFQKRGLDVKAIYFNSGSVMAQAMVAGDIVVSDSDVPAQLTPKISGIKDVRVVAVTINRLEHILVVRNQIKAPEDLRGKRIAISRFGSASDMTTRLALRSLKVNAERDVMILQSGNTPTRISALVAGHVDGALVSPEQVYKVLASKCCRVLADLSELPLDYARFGVVMPMSVLRGQRDTMRKLLEAYIEGIYLFKTRPDATQAVLRDGGVNDPQVAKNVYERLAGSLRQYPVPEPKGVQAALDSVMTAKDRNIQAQDYIDSSIVEEIKNSGYIDGLYKK